MEFFTDSSTSHLQVEDTQLVVEDFNDLMDNLAHAATEDAIEDVEEVQVIVPKV